MEEDFELPVTYQGKELLFSGCLHSRGYLPRIEIDVYGIPVLYERDEERNWRALVDPSLLEKQPALTINLLGAIAKAIEKVLE